MDPAPGGWTFNAAGRIAPGVGALGSLVRMADIDGDSRAEYLVMGKDNGSVRAWINNGPSSSSDSGWAWNPRGRIAPGAGFVSQRVLFGHLHARTGSHNNARADYVVVDTNTGAMNMWLSAGPPSGGSGYWNWNPLGTIADGERGRVLFAHIDADARDDYVYLAANGAVYTWINGGPDEYDWHYTGPIAPGAGVPGREVTFADVDGDVTIHPDTGALTLWENQGASGASDSGWAWEPRGRIASGVGARGEDTRLADVDGDRKDDYLVIGASNGSLTAWINGGSRPGSPTSICARTMPPPVVASTTSTSTTTAPYAAGKTRDPVPPDRAAGPGTRKASSPPAYPRPPAEPVLPPEATFISPISTATDATTTSTSTPQADPSGPRPTPKPSASVPYEPTSEGDAAEAVIEVTWLTSARRYR